MKKLIKLETIKWIRSKKLYIVMFVFLFFGLSSPLSTYYAKDIIKVLSHGSDTKLALEDPTWQALMQSYFKNLSDTILFIVAYICSSMCRLRPNTSIEYFYKTRIKHNNYLYFPKYIACIIMVTLGLIIGFISMFFITSIFFNNIDLSRVCIIFLIQLYGFLTLVSLSVVFSIQTKSPFLSVLLIEIIIILSGIIQSFLRWKDWFITDLINPIEIINKGVFWEYLKWSICVTSVILVLSLLIIVKYYAINRASRNSI